MKALADFETDLGEEVGDLSALIVPAEVERWVNEGRTRIGYLDKKTATVSWAAEDTEADLPADYLQFGRLVLDDGVSMPGYQVWGSKLVFNYPAESAGTGRIMYLAYFPTITSSAASTMPEEADRGILSYCLYRFFKKLSSNRSDYKRYSTLVGQNAVTMGDLGAEADRHYSDFVDSMDTLPVDPPTTFYGG